MTRELMSDLRIKALIAKISMQGVQISPEFLNVLLKNKDEASKILEEILKKLSTMENKPLIITPEFISDSSKQYEEEIDVKDLAEEIEVIFEPTEYILQTPLSKDFRNYFMSRYMKLRKIMISERYDARGAIDIRDLSNKKIIGATENKVKIICIVSDKKVSKSMITFDAEDLTGEVTVLVTMKNSDLLQKAQNIIPNEVICVEGIPIGEGKILATDILQPEIPRQINNVCEKRGGPDIYAVLISDLHIGSRFFMRHAFNKFLLWLNGVFGDAKLKGFAKRTKYVVIAGDIVDGIGIYPGQEKELAIKDLKRQYEVAAYYLSQIPQHVKIIIVPGNHDATRQALPSPTLYKEYAAPLYKLSNVIILGDPAYIKLHKSLFLITHGKSLDDIMVNIANLKYETPAKAMIELLKRRHIAPVYGGRTLIAPEEEDLMVIEKIPNVFHAGHIHTFEYTNYKGVTVVNSGTWQEQTEYMKNMGIYPNKAKAALINLNNNSVQAIIDFEEELESEGDQDI
ncbi:MAG: DNA-directed DNA polymerase II small subunit [archaeon YNP-LCB-003-016]|jgi:DNA polymerase II small subunit|uniref:DNA-directed DNA polymerase II small subunit n=1 Tax=Candidatus Culexarchaeum yellowstonense TaxID=2928963 RepID=UPI0026EECA54|nr:DNA-directed DNA polymerase II small subunit [Candidatus Culexarchaeum yellowstonense]MCR6690971.1 DNA-directed DNA polymerase II small subunit [Candidatus Culexarchaeum yellowstonense]